MSGAHSSTPMLSILLMPRPFGAPDLTRAPRNTLPTSTSLPRDKDCCHMMRLSEAPLDTALPECGSECSLGARCA